MANEFEQVSDLRLIKSELIISEGWISWMSVTGVWASWLLLTWFWNELPWWLLLPCGAFTLALYGSLQHEALHELMSVRRWMNHLFVYPPLNLWLPYPVYRASHLAHHRGLHHLTDPYRDPESYYVPAEQWASLSAWWRQILVFNHTLFGRLTIGPFLIVSQFLYHEAKALLAGDRRNLVSWLCHVPMVVLILFWVTTVCTIPAWQYLLLCVLPGTSLGLVRSYCEHIAHETPEERTALVEAGPLMSFLFLNNNLHYVHHKRPDLPWYAIPRYYRQHRALLRQENGHYVYDGGYLEVFRRFLFTPFDLPKHPFM
jgi:fatty acid desaturase